MILRYKARALADLEAIYDYIAQDDPIAARGVVQRIVRSIGRLTIIPLSVGPASFEGLEFLPYLAFPMSSSIGCVRTQ